MQKSKAWTELIIQLDPGILEIISPALIGLGADGIEELANSFKIYFPSERWAGSKEKAVLKLLRQHIPEFDAGKIEIMTIPAENWNESWKESFRTFKVTEQLVIRPDWEDYEPAETEQVIVIAPKMAFGTGHHETTQLVLRMMEKYIQPGTKVLDAGTGSGVLAIYAGILGAESLTAFDNDPVAIENTKENFELNNVKTPHSIFAGDIKEVSGRYNIILANIERNILLGLAEDFTKRIEENGMIILSGLLHTDRETVLEAYSNLGWDLLESDQKNEWITLVLKHGRAKK